MESSYDNSKINDWAKVTNLSDIKAEISALDIKHYPNSTNKVQLANNITVNIRQRKGQADKISYKFPRSAVFVHKGVGNGSPISKAGQTKRKAKRWFNNPTDRNMPELQSIVAENDATFIVNNLTIK